MLPEIHALPDLHAAKAAKTGFDALVVVSADAAAHLPAALGDALRAAAGVDARVGKDTTLLPHPAALGGRLIIAPTGPLNRDQDDVRRLAAAAASGARRARDAGARAPCLIFGVPPAGPGFERALEVGILGALGALWEPLEAREALGDDAVEPTRALGFIAPAGTDGPRLARTVGALEAGRRLTRDIAGTNQERMTPIRIAEYCIQAFEGTGVEVDVQGDVAHLEASYPLLSAVARASLDVPRHHPRVVRLEYVGEGEVTQTLFFVGKGVTYDTGGLDVKYGGHMAGMSRDKGGAAAVAGFVLTAALLKTPGVRIVAELGLVRNSVGANSFAADEIITAHSGVRVRIGNTDAEGRLVMADILSHFREEAKDAVAPHLFTVATLTGHAGRAVGVYSIAMDNGPAHAKRSALSLMDVGDVWGDCFAYSRLRPEDFHFLRPRTKADDVMSGNNDPSTATARGHQFPMFFLIRASGMESHGRDSDAPLPYTHIDIGGSAVEGGDWQHGRPTAAPVVALAGRYLMG